MRLLSASTYTGRSGESRFNSLHSRLSKSFCGGCGSPGRSPSREPRWAASASRSRTWAPAARKLLQEPALAGAGQAAHHAPGKHSRQRLQVGEHRAAVGAVAAFQTARLPADLGEHVRERGAASARRASSRRADARRAGGRESARADAARYCRSPAPSRACAPRTASAACRSSRRARAPRRSAPGS